MIVIIRPFINVFVVDMNSLNHNWCEAHPSGHSCVWGERVSDGEYKRTGMVIFSPQDIMIKPESSYLFFSGLHDRNYWVGLITAYLEDWGHTALLGAFYVLYWLLYKRWSDCLVRSLARVWKAIAIIESTRSIFQEFVSKAVYWVGGSHYFNNSFPGPNLQPTRFQSKLSVAIASLNQGLK